MRESTFTNAICKAESKQISKDFAYCENAVSRQAAIDALADMHCKSDEDEYVWIIRSDAWARIDALPSVTPKQRWIPWDSERLPDNSGTYIVTAYDGAKERVTFAMYQKRLKRWELTGARAYWRVLAWMPLPEPYRAERRTNE